MDNIILKYRAEKEDDVYYAVLPEFEDLIVSGDNDLDLINSIREVFSLYSYDLIEENQEEKLIEKINKNNKAEGSFSYISLYLPYEWSSIKEVYVNKTLTIPSWLNMLAINKNINCSEILRRGLKKELKIN